MKKKAKKADLELVLVKYHAASKEDKSVILDELVDLYNYNRKYLLQYFNFLTGKKCIPRGRKRSYDPKLLLEHIKRFWLASDQMCSRKLKIIIAEWLPFYEQQYGFLDKQTAKQLGKISSSTIDRLLRTARVKYKRHGLTGTKPGFLLKNQIPIKTDHWDVTQPGFMEADTVAHCGNSMAGNFIWSLTLTDICTCWTEIRAVWNKGHTGIIEAIKTIENMLPFAILGFDCDNGSEFLNWALIRYFTENRKQAVQFTRSRPYRKNDNAYVEQKNWTHVRNLLGYDRFDNPAAVALINDLYSHEWSLYQNHFVPTLKLIEKEKINSKYRRKYEKPKTPYQRIQESAFIKPEIKEKLKQTHVDLNPFILKKTIEKKLKQIFNYASYNPNPKNKI